MSTVWGRGKPGLGSGLGGGAGGDPVSKCWGIVPSEEEEESLEVRQSQERERKGLVGAGREGRGRCQGRLSTSRGCSRGCLLVLLYPLAGAPLPPPRLPPPQGTGRWGGSGAQTQE